jgi:hypothetical protein
MSPTEIAIEAAKAKLAAQAATPALPPGVPNPATQNAALMTPATLAQKKTALVLKIEQKKAQLADMERAAGVLKSNLNRAENKPGDNIEALNAKDAQIIAARDELESMITELASMEPKPASMEPKPAERTGTPMNDEMNAARLANARGTPPKASATGNKQVKAADVIAKIKKDDATEGKPTIWDYLEAAGSGFLGRKSAYAEKKTREIENKNEIDRLIKATELQAAAQASAQEAEQTNAIAQIQKRFDLENSSKLPSVPGLGPLASGLSMSGAIKLPGAK